ncbi:MAG: DNA gyrase subunit A [Patescibacteria group bacterium]|jgi:DNA gyrase subunit A
MNDEELDNQNIPAEDIEEITPSDEISDELVDEDPTETEASAEDSTDEVSPTAIIPRNSTITDRAITEDKYDPLIGNMKPRDLIVEMETSYLDYAMSVIVSRALPDVRDGLKPVHRRVLYGMHSTGLRHNVKYRKSAKVVGEVMGNYHPHGDTAIYDSLVRMAQDFSMRYMLVDGQGNFGSMDGDGAAAMRYTECRMSSIAEEMLADIDKDTVNWVDNYDGSTQEPVVLPARVPQLLLNGTMGIAVGMATNIPPHNLTELCDATAHLIDNPEANVDNLMEFVKGPDFPTGGIIYNNEDIKMAYATGKGKIVMRAKADIEEGKRGFRIIITEIPYLVNKSSMIEKIADLVKEKKIEGISDLRDESDRRGVRVVVELKSNSYPRKVLNRLFELTPMQTAFHVNMLALTPDLEPQVMTLKDVLGYYIEHRKEVIERRTRFELKKAEDRAHILEGLKIALDHIDEVINTIRASANRDDAKTNLMKKFSFSERQADAILEMRLSALAALERKRIEDEYNEILSKIAYLKDLLDHPEKILGLIKDDLNEVKEKYGDARRTAIMPHALGDFSAEDLIPDEQVIVAFTRGNYIKRQETDTYRRQIRGGVGIVGMTTKEEDIVDYLVGARTHDDIYFFSNKGRVFKSKVYELPATSRQSKGTPIVNIIQIGQDEKVTAILTIPKSQNAKKYFVIGTVLGAVKKTEIEKYDNIRKTGIIAMGLKTGDELKWVKSANDGDIVVAVSEKGQAICYREADARPMGRSASGVTGMKLRRDDKVMSMDLVPGSQWPEETTKKNLSEPDMLIVLENGFGKRTMLRNFHIQKRGGMGIRAASCTTKTGNVIGMHIVYDDKADVVLASRKGQFIRMEIKNIKRLGRDTQGVTLMRLHSGDKVSSVALIQPEEKSIDQDQPELLGTVAPVETLPIAKKGKTDSKKAEPKPATAVSKAADDGEIATDKPDMAINAVVKPNLSVKFYNDKVKVDPDNRDDESAKSDPKDDPEDKNYWGKK